MSAHRIDRKFFSARLLLGLRTPTTRRRLIAASATAPLGIVFYDAALIRLIFISNLLLFQLVVLPLTERLEILLQIRCVIEIMLNVACLRRGGRVNHLNVYRRNIH